LRGALNLSKHGAVLPSFRDEAQRIVGAAKEESVLLRVIGALAFNMHCPKFGYLQEALGRTYTDLDFATYAKQVAKVSKLFAELGYREDFMVTRLFGSVRLLFHENGGNNRHCDVFLDKLQFCHDIPFQDRLEVDEPTAPLAELLLEKMQIVELNQKDVIDTMMLLREHELDDSDDDIINTQRIAQLCSRDWGLWKTVTTNLERIGKFTMDMEKLTQEDKTDVTGKIEKLVVHINDEPKSTGWKMRARIGEKRKWYRDVEELSRI
jgi:hypothetical protein